MGKKDTTPLKFQKNLALENVPLSNSQASPPPPSSPNLRGGGGGSYSDAEDLPL